MSPLAPAPSRSVAPLGRRRLARSAARLLLASTLAGGCGTVDVGPPTGPPMGCNASPAYFVQHVWPEFIKTATGGSPPGCDKSDCHDAQTGHGAFRLQSVAGVAAPDPSSSPTTWPDPWRANLAASLRLLDCNEPLDSQLLVVPENRAQPHPPGDVVPDHAAAEALFQAWTP